MKNTNRTTKRKLFFFIAMLLISGTIGAQENQYQFNYHLFEYYMPIVAQIKIDGVEQTSNEIELGSFNGDIVTGSERIGQYGSAGYYRVYMAVFFNEPYEVSFKIYNHATGEELDNYEITYLGEPYNLVLNEDGLGTNKKPVVINFITTTSQTLTKEIAGYGNGNDNWYLIASPFAEDITPTTIGIITNDEGEGENATHTYDLYWFDQSEQLEWRNYRLSSFDLVNGKGYLYANKNDVTLTFTGTPIEGPTHEVSLVKDDSATFPGWNLVGNPFAVTAYIDHDFYVMNDEGSEIIVPTNPSSGIAPMEGVFVIANENDESLSFSTEAPDKQNRQIVVNVTHNHGTAIDRAVIRFGEGPMLPKFQIRDDSPSICIPMDGQDYAIVHSKDIGEMPLNFKAEKSGTYSINVNAKYMGMNYLHLIDNMTGADVDLLVSPDYTFTAMPNDYASRFRLVFSVSEDLNSEEASFAFIKNGNLVVLNEGEATLQIIDITGHIINSMDINGPVEVNLNQAEGVYTLRLINGEKMKVQKIVTR